MKRLYSNTYFIWLVKKECDLEEILTPILSNHDEDCVSVGGLQFEINMENNQACYSVFEGWFNG